MALGSSRELARTAGWVDTVFKLGISPWSPVWLSGLSASLEPKGCWFDSQSGHMLAFRAGSPVGGVRGATTH